MTQEPRRPQLSDALRLMDAVRLVWRAAPGWTALNIALAVLQGIVPLLTVYLMKLIVDAVTQGVVDADHAAAFRTAAVYIGIAAAVGLAAALLRSLSALTSEALGQTVTDHVGLGELFRAMFRDLRTVLRGERIGIARAPSWAPTTSSPCAAR